MRFGCPANRLIRRQPVRVALTRGAEVEAEFDDECGPTGLVAGASRCTVVALEVTRCGEWRYPCSRR